MQSTSNEQNRPLPTLIFVHGACHTPQSFERIIPLLEVKGFNCVAPQMLFCGTAEPLKSLTPCVQQVSDLIELETKAGRNVVMVNHSFGGVAGSSGVRGFSGKNSSRLQREQGKSQGHVVGIFLISAIMVSSYGPLRDVLYLMAENNKHDEQGWIVLPEDPKGVFYHDLQDEDAELWSTRLIKQSPCMPASDDDVYAGWLDVPMWYLICEADQAVSVAVQEDIERRARSMGSEGEQRRIAAAHFPFLSQPSEVVNIIEEAVTNFMKQHEG